MKKISLSKNSSPDRVSSESASEHQVGYGLFIVFEGLDGCGKTTQAYRLVDRLQSLNIPALYVKEPTAGPWGQKIRRIALIGRSGVTPAEELEYFIRDREEDVRLNITPARLQGRIVVADRYFYSNIAYQSALGLDAGEIRQRNASFPVPELVFFLDIPPELSQDRITRRRGDKPNKGYEQKTFLIRVHKEYQALTDPNIVRLNGDRPEDEIAEEIWLLMEPLLAERRHN
ncbi:MAG: dTMP kinase [Deltaproteobacteria bacterium]|nr:dTMP kinase [Deltaproteobacteria bacterium]